MDCELCKEVTIGDGDYMMTDIYNHPHWICKPCFFNIISGAIVIDEPPRDDDWYEEMGKAIHSTHGPTCADDW
jgi:hypothetical protein